MTLRVPRPSPIRPPALIPGDTVGIVAPASNIDQSALEAGCQALSKLGYVPYYLESILKRDLYFAGSVERRIAELEHMFERPEVRAIVCARGGYGTNYLLPHFNVGKILAYPKPFIGYSDNTSLLTWISDHGLVTFHGPMVTKDFANQDGVDVAWWMAVLGTASRFEKSFDAGEAETLIEGEAEGILYGGCLSMLVASLGTHYEIQTDETLLFLEDMNEKPYQIDRMLTQLRLAGKLKNVRGFIFGEMLDCRQAQTQDYILQDVIRRVLGDLHVPIIFGLKSGHVSTMNRVLPLGVVAKLTAGASVRLQFEAAVSARSTSTQNATEHVRG